MPQALYRVSCHASPTGNTPGAKVALVASTAKTVIQLLHPTLPINVVEVGASFDAAGDVQCELIQTTTVAATVTAYVANDITSLSNPTGAVPGMTLSTSGSGFTSTGEGTVVAPVRMGDEQLVVAQQYLKQFPLGQEFQVPALGILRLRLTASTGLNALAYVTFTIG